MPQVWKWTKKKEQAAALLFAGRLTQAKIAEQCGVSTRAIESWVRNDQFQVRLAEWRADFVNRLRQRGVLYLDKEQRIIGFSEMAEAARLEYEAHPLLVERRQIGFDKKTKKPIYMENESFNRDAHAAFRESLKEIAEELGDRKQKVELTGKDGERLTTDAGLALAASLLPRLENGDAREALAMALLQEATIIDAAPQPQ